MAWSFTSSFLTILDIVIGNLVAIGIAYWATRNGEGEPPDPDPDPNPPPPPPNEPSPEGSSHLQRLHPEDRAIFERIALATERIARAAERRVEQENLREAQRSPAFK